MSEVLEIGLELISNFDIVLLISFEVLKISANALFIDFFFFFFPFESPNHASTLRSLSSTPIGEGAKIIFLDGPSTSPSSCTEFTA